MTTAARGRCLTTNINMGLNKLLSFSTYMADFSDEDRLVYVRVSDLNTKKNYENWNVYNSKSGPIWHTVSALTLAYEYKSLNNTINYDNCSDSATRIQTFPATVINRGFTLRCVCAEWRHR